MQCEEFEDRLNAVLDERKRPEADAEVRLHCEACADCRHLAAAYARLLDGFYALSTPEPAGDIAVRVLADLHPPASPRRRLAVGTASLAAAAALLIAVMPLLRNDRRAPIGSLPRINLATSQQVGSHAAGTLEALDVNQLPIVPELLALRTAGPEAYAGLAKETGQGLAAFVLYVPGIGGSKGIVDANGSDEPAWAVQMSEGLKPITDSVAETVNLLLRALPGAVSARS
jgi:hypothetical protein